MKSSGHVSALSVLFVFVIYGISVKSVQAYSVPTRNCDPCIPPACGSYPSDCHFGIVKDRCGRLVCAKGPGHKCGGRFDYHGRCGEGLFCNKSGRCQGCSLLTLDPTHCYPRPGHPL